MNGLGPECTGNASGLFLVCAFVGVLLGYHSETTQTIEKTVTRILIPSALRVKRPKNGLLESEKPPLLRASERFGVDQQTAHAG